MQNKKFSISRFDYIYYDISLCSIIVTYLVVPHAVNSRAPTRRSVDITKISCFLLEKKKAQRTRARGDLGHLGAKFEFDKILTLSHGGMVAWSQWIK